MKKTILASLFGTALLAATALGMSVAADNDTGDVVDAGWCSGCLASQPGPGPGPVPEPKPFPFPGR